MTRRWSAHLAVAACLLPGLAGAEIENPIDELRRCASIAEAPQRFACYEALGERAMEEAVPVEQAAASAAPAAAATVPMMTGASADWGADPEMAAAAAETATTADVAETSTVPPAAASETASAAAPVTAAAATVAGAASDEAEQLPESLGGATYEEASGKQPKTYQGHLIECREASDAEWLFVFENGQVWKQTDNKIRRFRDCDATATITKDLFGYKMEIEGVKGKVRVARRR